MKKLFAAFILCAFTSLGLSARTQNDRPVTLKGHAVTEEKAPVDYATVILTAKADSTKVYGSITDEKGGFTVEMPKGSYRLKISFMGYDSFEREVNLAADTDLGELTMKPSSVMLDEVSLRTWLPAKPTVSWSMSRRLPFRRAKPARRCSRSRRASGLPIKATCP